MEIVISIICEGAPGSDLAERRRLSHGRLDSGFLVLPSEVEMEIEQQVAMGKRVGEMFFTSADQWFRWHLVGEGYSEIRKPVLTHLSTKVWLPAIHSKWPALAGIGVGPSL